MPIAAINAPWNGLTARRFDPTDAYPLRGVLDEPVRERSSVSQHEGDQSETIGGQNAVRPHGHL
ncbi:MAG: hypothetical protein FWD57_15520 [Polyangiaceae bacterium]|nr:hypothetical protein [Polyangiaceae bacterium]